MQSTVRYEQGIDPAEEPGSAKGPGEHGGDDFAGVGNLKSSHGAGGAIDHAHFRRALSQMQSQIRATHIGGVQFGDEEVDGTGAGLGQLERLTSIFGRKNEEVGILENFLNIFTERFGVFDHKNDRVELLICLRTQHNKLSSLDKRTRVKTHGEYIIER